MESRYRGAYKYKYKPVKITPAYAEKQVKMAQVSNGKKSLGENMADGGEMNVGEVPVFVKVGV